jgi:hypothetical protein
MQVQETTREAIVDAGRDIGELQATTNVENLYGKVSGEEPYLIDDLGILSETLGVNIFKVAAEALA